MRTRMEWGTPERPPRLMDVAYETPEEAQRWYLVVGVEEHRDSPRVWNLVLERVEVGTLPDDPDAIWGFQKVKRT